MSCVPHPLDAAALSAQQGKNIRPPDTPSTRIHLVLVAAAGLTLASNGPSVVLGVYILNLGLSFETWPFVYAFTAVSIAGVALLWGELRQRPCKSWPWPIWPLIALLAWALLSVTWSVRPDLTAYRAIVAIGIAAFGVWFGTAFRFREQILALTFFSIAVSTSSILTIAFRPRLGRGGVDGSWSGIFANPNSLAPAAVVGVMAAAGLLVEYRSPSSRVGAIALGALNLTLLVKSMSVTGYSALLAAAVVAVPFMLIPTAKRQGWSGRAVGWSAGFATFGFVAYGWSHVGTLADAAGQNPTVSSRTIIWDATFQFISNRPLHGYGYWAFWENSLYSEPIGRWYGSAHNSVLETAIGLGWVGAVLFVTIVLAAVSARARACWLKPSAANVWWMAFLAAILAEHTTESFVLWHSYVWILLVSAAFLPIRAEIPDVAPTPADCDEALSQ